MQIKNTTYSLLLTLFLGMGIATVVAQNNNELRESALETRSFDENVWQKLNEELDYSGEAPEPKSLEEKEEREGFDFDDLPNLSPVLQVVLIGVLISLLAWLVYTIIVANQVKSLTTSTKIADRGEEVVSLKRLEEELDKNDVYPLLFQAEEDKNYHLAVRLHFLALLKKLHASGNIHWKKDLTNRAYLRQMRAQQGFPTFRALTHTFERVWYGHQIPDESEYQQIKKAFNTFKSTTAEPTKSPADE